MYVTGKTSRPLLPAVTSARAKKAMFVELVLVKVMVAVSCPEATVREAEAVTLEFEVRLFNPVRLAYVLTEVLYQLPEFPSASGVVEYQYKLLLMTVPEEFFSCRRMKYVVDSPLTVGIVNACVDEFAGTLIAT